LSMGGCNEIAAWPGVAPVGGFDDQAVATFASSADQMALPFRALTVEDYHAMGAPYPKTVAYQQGDSYFACDVCPLLERCDAMGCSGTHFAQAGSVTITRSDQDPVMGRFTATVSD